MAFSQSNDWTVLSKNESATSMVPPDCKVVFYNDDYTTKDFVVMVLTSIFHKSNEEANFLMESVHRDGQAVVGVYTYDIAATRTEITVRKARAAGFPLKVELEF